MTIASIDPAYAKPHAIAIYQEGMLGGVFKSDNMRELILTFLRCDRVFIEDQYFSRNADILKKLAQATGKLLGLLEYAHIPYELVPPAIWQNYYNLYGRKPKDIKPGEWQKLKDKMLIEKAREYGYSGDDPDISASVLIGHWGINRQKV